MVGGDSVMAAEKVEGLLTSGATPPRSGGSQRKRLLFLLPYPLHTVPGQRLKFEQYFGVFQQAGFDITVRSFIDPAFYAILYRPGQYVQKVVLTLRSYVRRFREIREAASYDVVYVHLWVAPFGPPLFEHLLRRSGARIIYDIDDLVFRGHASTANWFMKFVKGRSNATYLMAVSDHVIVCTEYLRACALAVNSRVTNISSTIDTGLYVPRRRVGNGTRVCIGWSGSHSTVAYLSLLAEVFKALRRRYDFSIKVIGDVHPPLPGLNVSAQEWRLDTEVEDLQEIDIGVYPLPENEWVLGKSGLKALQYMALGIPTIATGIGAVLEIITDGENGFLARSHEEWVEKLSRLIEDPDLRRRIGEQGRKTVEARYSVAVNAAQYLAVLHSVCDGAVTGARSTHAVGGPRKVTR